MHNAHACGRFRLSQRVLQQLSAFCLACARLRAKQKFHVQRRHKPADRLCILGGPGLVRPSQFRVVSFMLYAFSSIILYTKRFLYVHSYGRETEFLSDSAQADVVCGSDLTWLRQLSIELRTTYRLQHNIQECGVLVYPVGQNAAQSSVRDHPRRPNSSKA